MKHVEEKKGEIYSLLKVLVEAMVPVGAHYGATVMPQLEFLGIITLMSALLFVITTAYYKQFHQLFVLKHVPSLLAYTLTIAVIPYGIIFYATRYSTAIDTSLLLQSEVVYAALIGYFFLKEKMPPLKLAGILLILAASLLLLYKGDIQLSWPNLAIMLAPVIFVCGNIIAKRLQKQGVGWSSILLFRQFVGGVLLLAVSFLIESPITPPLQLVPFIVVYSIVGFGLSKIFWQLALHRLDISKVTALLGVVPIMSSLLAYLWLNEIPSTMQWVSLGLIVAGVVLLFHTTSKQWANAKTPTQMPADY